MCGIFAYAGPRKNAVKIVLEGLKNLEYRGYDSWGIGVKVGEKFSIDKHAGKIGNAKVNLPQGNFVFGHTRWATHGGVTDINAHPHLDCSGKIAVVHNGIIENYQEIKKLLAGKHKIISETDTELLAHLIEDYRKKHPLLEAVRLAFLNLRGLSAFLIAEGGSQTFIAVKTGSPLIVGIGKEENVIGSDVNCLLSLTRNVIFLEDGQLVEITKNRVNIFETKTGRKINPKVHKITWKENTAILGNFPTFLLKEIYEQPKVIQYLAQNTTSQIKKLAERIKKAFGTYLIGCGSAYYASLAGTYLFSKIAKKHVNAQVGSEFGYLLNFLTEKSLVIALSQSGETIDIIESVNEAKQKGAKIVALVNNLGSTLYRLADEKILLSAGPEKAVASTKAFTAKLALLVLLAYAVSGNLEKGRKVLLKAVASTQKILQKNMIKKITQLAKKISQKEHIYVIGRGISYPLALESALKIKEESYIHAEAFAGGELKHAVISLVEKDTPCIVLAPNDETYDTIVSGAMEMKARGGYIIGITSNQVNPESRATGRGEVFDEILPVEDCGEGTCIPNVVVSQLLAYYLAKERGCDIDKPRNLAKSVTVK